MKKLDERVDIVDTCLPQSEDLRHRRMKTAQRSVYWPTKDEILTNGSCLFHKLGVVVIIHVWQVFGIILELEYSRKVTTSPD